MFLFVIVTKRDNWAYLFLQPALDEGDDADLQHQSNVPPRNP